MLADLFKPAWKSRSVEKRLEAISAMDSFNSEKQSILAQLAAEDEAVSIRIAALQKLTSVDSLVEISKQDADDSVRSQAEKRIDELLASGEFLDKAQYHDLLMRHPELTARIAAYANIDAVRNEIIPGLSPSQLVEVLTLSTYTDSRQLAAERLTQTEANVETLESARKMLLGKDKKAERILKEKIDEIKKQQQQHAENLATVTRLIEEVEYLVNHDWRPEFKARLLVHRSQWDNLDFEIDPVSMQRYQAARHSIDSRFEEQNIIEQARQSQQQLLDEIRNFLQETTAREIAESIASLSDTHSRLKQYSSSWLQLADKSPPDAGAQDQYDTMLGALKSASQLLSQAADILQRELEEVADESIASRYNRETEYLANNVQELAAALKNFQWPAAYDGLKAADELQLLLADWRKTLERSVAERKQQLDRLHKKISSIFRFSRAGNLVAAKQFCERVERGLEEFDGTDRASLEERFQEARKTLGDMCDWKNFAAEPKYIELCEAMEALSESAQHPEKRSSEMKTLQHKWKALGYSDISEQYWPRFKLAADKVYQPCVEFFEKRHKIRKANLERRQHYVEQMRKLLEETDWDETPDYKVVQSSVRDISNGFTSIKEVEYKDGQKQWKQFSNLKNQVNAKLDTVYDANISLKRDLIGLAEALAEAPAREENLARLKSLQTRWKQVGITRRKQDQKAWLEFKKHGDAVYNKVRQLRDGHRAEVEEQLDAYREVIKQIRKLAATAEDLAAADHRFSELQASYEELPELPEDLPEKLLAAIQRDYRDACDQFDRCHIRIANNKHLQQVVALRQRANLCAQLEALGTSPAEQQLQEISQQWDAIELHDPALSRRIEQRRKSAREAIDRAAIAEKRRMLCIQLEIALDIESPAEDRQRRMQYQLAQMNKTGLGQQIDNLAELVENLELDWLCMPGAEPDQQKALDERFQRALRAK
ncbi:MAG: DUF349 domain-containing protein [Gammaproteobacteria bacterium]|nr:DUF349 domain-containing protein [Gammaproteobacteria bacterium]